jgi:hypothetical protein
MNSANNIPGYSGHIPYKNHLVGLTNGAGNRVAEATYRTTSSGKFTGLGSNIIEGDTPKKP